MKIIMYKRNAALLLINWGWMTHVCVGKLTITGSDNGLSPGRRQAIILPNAGILLIRPLETNFNEILIKIHTFSFKEMHLKISSGKWRPFCLGLDVTYHYMDYLLNCFLFLHHQSIRSFVLIGDAHGKLSLIRLPGVPFNLSGYETEIF